MQHAGCTIAAIAVTICGNNNNNEKKIKFTKALLHARIPHNNKCTTKQQVVAQWEICGHFAAANNKNNNNNNNRNNNNNNTTNKHFPSQWQARLVVVYTLFVVAVAIFLLLPNNCGGQLVWRAGSTSAAASWASWAVWPPIGPLFLRDTGRLWFLLLSLLSGVPLCGCACAFVTDSGNWFVHFIFIVWSAVRLCVCVYVVCDMAINCRATRTATLLLLLLLCSIAIASSRWLFAVSYRRLAVIAGISI